jgi:hypothetical protein
VVIAFDFKPIEITISVTENLLYEYSKDKLKKPMLSCGLKKEIDDIILIFDYITCNHILKKACKYINK